LTIVVALIILAAIIGVNIFLWKSGFLFDAERPRPLIDQPARDPKARQAALTRISRWRAEGRISREEAERWQTLCEQNWDLKSDD
jgi:hypothetical protein